MLRTVLANSALTLASLLLALLAAEAGLRLMGYLPGNPLERLINHYDAYLGYRMIPGMHETIAGPGGTYTADVLSLGFDDGTGFRDDGVTPPVDSVFIGDSFVWGYGVNLAESISERFEALTGRDAVNLGMTSWTSPTQYARLLARYGVALKPHRAFMEVFVGNDLGDLPNFAAWEASGSRKSYPEWMTDRVMHYSPDTLSYRIRRVLYDHSALGRLVSDRVQFGFGDGPQQPDRDIVRVAAPGLDLDLDRRELTMSSQDAGARQTTLFRSALVASRDAAAAHGIELVVFIVPTKEMVYQDRFPEPPLRATADRRYVAMKAVVDELGIACVDLLGPLRAAAARGQLYFSRDTHWTALGHDVAARALLDCSAGRCSASGCPP
jgi:hypothetical protein